jgi:hypothetical protein
LDSIFLRGLNAATGGGWLRRFASRRLPRAAYRNNIGAVINAVVNIAMTVFLADKLTQGSVSSPLAPASLFK